MDPATPVPEGYRRAIMSLPNGKGVNLMAPPSMLVCELLRHWERFIRNPHDAGGWILHDRWGRVDPQRAVDTLRTQDPTDPKDVLHLTVYITLGVSTVHRMAGDIARETVSEALDDLLASTWATAH